jgi:hypothetical protein
MASLLAKIDDLAGQANIAFVPLKGEAMHANGLYAAGDRPMADIDLLVRQRDLVPMSQHLRNWGITRYRSLRMSISSCHHQATKSRLGEHADNGITIELHARPVCPCRW